MHLKPLYPAKAFRTEFGIPNTRFYELVKQGALKVRKIGGRTYVTGEDAQRFLDSLPQLGVAA